MPEREPMLEVLIKRHYREHELHGLRTAIEDGPPVRRRRLHARRAAAPTSSPPSGWCRRAGRRQRAGARRHRRGGRAPDRLRLRRRPLPVLAGRAGVARARPPSELAALLAQLAFAQQVRRVAVAVCAGGGPSRRATSPSALPRAPWSRTASSAACTPWSGAGSTSGGSATSTSPGSRRPRTCCSTTASPRATRPTSASSRSRRCASSSWCATRRARSPPCRTPSAPSPTASRRSAGPGRARGAAGQRLDMNHVWVADLAHHRGRPRPAHRPPGQDRRR